ncbi:MAG: TlpA family protein disulfide reductase [Phycisphaerae bacterium]|nr:TlpA family protein disulfide reductase [Phycisphaerae bacterium]
MNKRYYIVTALFVFTLLLPPVAATADEQDAWAKSRLGKTRLGKMWIGEPLELEDLRGQVVLLEFWGYKDTLCVASLSHLSKLNKKYGRNGLVVIGTHSYDSRKSEAISVAISKGVNFRIMSHARVPKVNELELPRVFVFNHQGKVVFEGRPDDKMNKAIVKALKARPDPLLGGMKYKKLADVAKKIKTGKLGEAYKKCEESKDADGRLGEEAAYLFANLEHYAKRLEEKAENEKESPIAAMIALAKLKKSFAGTEYGDNAAEKIKKLKKDKEFQTELKADKIYLAIRRASWRVAPRPTDKAQQAKWAKMFGKGLRAIKLKVEKLKKKYPDTTAAEKAETLLNNLMGE